MGQNTVGPARMLPVIRKAEPKDVDAISLGESETSRTRGLLNALPGEIPKAAFLERINALHNSANGIYFVAEREGEILGHLLLNPMPLKSNSHVCCLNIVVYPKWRGNGVGRRLLTTAIAWARDNPAVEKIELLVRSANERAIHLYKSVGFEEVGILRNRVREADGVYYDDIAMALFVDEKQARSNLLEEI